MVQFLTLRLHDALPKTVVEGWKTELRWKENLPASDPREVKLRRLVSKYEDAGYGACWLRDDRIAATVEETLLVFDGQRYRLIAWCVMPNHIHVLIETWEGWSLGDVVHAWKSFTAHAANRILGRSGDFWFREYFDRFIRDDRHFSRAVNYIENNPVKAGLVGRREEWRWSSAFRRFSGTRHLANNAENPWLLVPREVPSTGSGGRRLRPLAVRNTIFYW